MGPALGVVKDGECGDKVEMYWADGGCDFIKRKYIRRAPDVGEKFTRDGVTYEAKELLDRGVRALVTKDKQTARKSQKEVANTAAPRASKRSRGSSQKSPAKKKPAKPAPPCTFCLSLAFKVSPLRPRKSWSLTGSQSL